MLWGLIPHWAKNASGAASTINARSETAATKPAFRDPLKLRRCLIPADGFYEWKRMQSSKQPYCFEVNDRQLFAFAGLWDRAGDCRRFPFSQTSADQETKGKSRHSERAAGFALGIESLGDSLS
jgi:putative SOS response-associated peptidase YedK